MKFVMTTKRSAKNRTNAAGRLAVRDNVLFTDICGEILGSGRNIRFRARGVSMGNTVRDGESVLVAPVEGGLANGDVAMAQNAGQWRLHRIENIDKENKTVVMRGDALQESDLTVEPSAVIGKMFHVEHEGTFTRFKRRVQGRLARGFRKLQSTKTIRIVGCAVLIAMFALMACVPAQASTLGNYAIRQDGIYSLNGATGSAVIIYNGTPFPLTGSGMIAQRVADNMIFFMDWNGTVNNLYQWNPNYPTTAPILIGAVTLAGTPISSIFNQMTFQFSSNTDTLYAMTPSSTAGSALLYKINTVTAIATLAATNTVPTTSLTITNANIPAPPSPVTLPNNVATITTNLPHGLAPGQSVTVAGVGNALFNGTFTIVATPTPTTFTYNVFLPNVGAATVGGTAANNVVDNTVGSTRSAQTIANSGGTRTAGVMTIKVTAALNAADAPGDQMTITSMSDTTFQEVCILLTLPGGIGGLTFTCNDPPKATASSGGTVTGYLTGDFAFAPSGTLYLADRTTLYTVPLTSGAIAVTGSAINGFGSVTENVSGIMFDVIGRALVQTINTNGTSNDQVYSLNYLSTNSLAALTGTMGKTNFGGITAFPQSDFSILKTSAGVWNSGTTSNSFYALTVTNKGVSNNGNTISTLTVSDILPIDLSNFVYGGTGWGCSVSVQTLTCTRTDGITNSSSYPSIFITTDIAASPTLPAAVNSATVSGGGEMSNPTVSIASGGAVRTGALISNIQRTTGVTTITTSLAHGLTAGQQVIIYNATDQTMDGIFTIASVPTTTTLTYTQTGYADSASQASIGSASGVGNVTLTTSSALTASIGQTIQVLSVADATFNGTFIITNISGTTITYSQPGAASSSGFGTVSLPNNSTITSDNSSTVTNEYSFTSKSVCANSPVNQPNNIGGIINDYWPATASVVAGATSITLGTRNASGAGNNIAAGDLLLVMQMQDEDMDSTNTSSYGSGQASGNGSGYTNINSTGLFEYMVATSAITGAGGTLSIKSTGSSGLGLLNAYHVSPQTATAGQKTYQVIRVPQYGVATATSNLTAASWNGSTGGVFAADVVGQLNLNGFNIDVSGKGFRGAGGRILANETANTVPNDADYRTLSISSVNGGKGEGTAGTPRYTFNVTSGTATDNNTVTNNSTIDTVANSGVTRTGNVLTVKTTTAHNLAVGNAVAISGTTDGSATGGNTNTIDGNYVVASVPTTTIFTVVQAPSATSGSSSFGNPQAQAQSSVAIAIPAGGAVRTGGNLVTITLASNHGFTAGNSVVIAGVTTANFNGTFTIVATPTSNSFTYTSVAANSTSGNGIATSQSAVNIANAYTGAVRDSSGNVTITTTSVHGFTNGAQVTISNVLGGGFNGVFTMTSAAGSTLTFKQFNNITTPLSGGGTVVGTSEGYPNGSSARGAPGNAGGGGNDGQPVNNQENSGGGGGSNVGIGGAGGNTWQSNLPYGGYGGGTFVNLINKFAMGGGGGSGTTNNGTGPLGSNNAVRAGTLVTVTTTDNHPYAVGGVIFVEGMTGAGAPINGGPYIITTVADTTHFTFNTAASGTITSANYGGYVDVAVPACGSGCAANGINSSGSAGGGLIMIRAGSVTGPAATTKTISTVARSATYTVITTSTAHGFTVGQMVTISGITANSSFNGTFIVATVPSTTTFTYHQVISNVASFTPAGSPTASVLSTLNASGATSLNLLNDSGGGGGAGGAIMILGASNSFSNLNMTTRGGDGGSPWLGHTSLIDRHGPGGGGGGGVMFLSGTPNIADVSGGSSGASTAVFDTYGTAGTAGAIINQNGALNQVPGAASAANCAVDLTVTMSHSGNFYSGGTGSYTITASNASPNNSVNFTITNVAVTNGSSTVVVSTQQSLNVGLNQVIILSGTGDALLDGMACTVTVSSSTNQFSCTLPSTYSGVTNATDATSGTVYASAAQITSISSTNGSPTVTVISSQPQNLVAGQVIQISGVTTGTVAQNTYFGTTAAPVNCTVATVTDSTHYTCTSAAGNASSTVTLNPTGSGVMNSGLVSVTVDLNNASPPVPLTYSSAGGSGWTCNGAGTTAVCTRLDVAQANTSYPPITLTVNVGVGSGTDTPKSTVAGGGEYNTSNDTATDPTIIIAAPAFAADVALAKTGTPDPIPVNSSLTYTLTTMNAGVPPAATSGATVATGMSITDVLPSNIPPQSSQSDVIFNSFGTNSGWSCTNTGPSNGTTITCNGSSFTVNSGASRTSNVAGSPCQVSFTTTATHNLVAGQVVNISGVTTADPFPFNGSFAVLASPAPTGTTFAVNQPGCTAAATTTSTGTATLGLASGGTVNITSATAVTTTATITTNKAHGFIPGQSIRIAGMGDALFNGTFTIISVPSATTFTYTYPGGTTTSGNGTATVAGKPEVRTIAASAGGLVRAGTVVTVTTTTAHPYIVGQSVTIAGAGVAAYNATWVVTAVPTTTTFTFTIGGAPANSGGGTTSATVSNIRTPASSGATRTGGVTTITTGNLLGAVVHGYAVNDSVVIAGVTDATFNGTFTIASVPTTSTFTFNQATGGTASGQVWGIAANGAVRTGGNTVTITTNVAHGLTAGQSVTISGVPIVTPQDTDFNGTFTIVSTPTTTSFTYTQAGNNITSGTGWVTLSTTSTGLTSSAVTVNVTPKFISTSAYMYNTGNLTTTTSDLNTSNNSSTFVSIVEWATAVVLDSLRAYQKDGAVAFEWRTKEEIRNFGFNIYRGTGNSLVKLNHALVAGAALTYRWAAPQHTAKTYTWMDADPVGNGPYWLEDIEMNGARTLHGPVYIDQSGTAQTLVSAAPFATESFYAVRPPVYRPSSSGTYRAGGFMQQPNSIADLNVNNKPVITRGDLAAPLVKHGIGSTQQMQFNLASKPGVKINVTQEGWVRVKASDLFAAGLDTNTNPATLQLYAYGMQQPIRIIPASGTMGMQLTTNDIIEFFGLAADTTYTGTHVYWLAQGTQRPARIPTESFGTQAPAVSNFRYTAERRDRSAYVAALINGKEDNFLGDAVAGITDEAITLNHVDTQNGSDAQLHISLQGLIQDVPHTVNVKFNGSDVGTMQFGGQELGTAEFNVSAALLKEGTNTVTLSPQNGDEDISGVDTIRVTYSHSLVADNNYLRLSTQASTLLHVSGFTSSKIHMVDVTNGIANMEITSSIVQEGSTYAILAVTPPSNMSGGSGSMKRTVVVYAEEAIQSPASIDPHTPSQWHKQQSGADMVIVTHPAFTSSLSPLVSLRQAQGHTVATVPVDQLYDEYNFGEHSPQVIRDFLANTHSSWTIQPQYLLLMGDASVDPRNFLGQGAWDMVPTKIVNTTQIMTARDDWFSDFDDSGFAQLSTGRIPVRTVADATNVINKIVGYDAAPAQSWTNKVLMVSDIASGYNFAESTASTEKVLPDNILPMDINVQNLQGNARSLLLSSIDQGQLIVNYIGHGSTDTWSSAHILDGADAATMGNSGRLSVFMSMSCLNGFFHDVYSTSLAESLLLAPNGAVGMFASSGLSNSGPQSNMDRQIISLLFANPNMTIGDAIRLSKQNVMDTDVRFTWHWFGDPTMHMKTPQSNVSSTAGKSSNRSNRLKIK